MEWLKANRLSLNKKKTNFMIFPPKIKRVIPEINIYINKEKITMVYECRFLGVIINNNLNWNGHIKHLESKISRSVGIIGKARKYLGGKIMETLYYTMVYPYLLYCNLLWGNANDKTLWPIFKLQKKAIRLIVNVSRREKSTPYFKKLNIIKLPDVYKNNVSIFMYHYLNNNLPETFSDYFIMANSIHNVNTRQKNRYRVPLYKTAIGSKFVKKTGIEIWENILENYGFEYELDKFKLLIKATYLAEY